MHHLHTVFIVSSSLTVTTIINIIMRCYRMLDVPNYKVISNKFDNFLIHHTDFLYRALDSEYPMKWDFLDTEKLEPYIPELFDYLKQNNIDIFFLAAIGIRSCSVVGTHVDTVDKNSSVRIIWPVSNCEHSLIYFYEAEKKYYKRKFSETWISDSKPPEDSDTGYYDVEGGPHKIIDQITLTQPIIIDTSIPHSVVNKTYGTYVCFTVQATTSLRELLYK